MLQGPNAQEDIWPSIIRTILSHVRNRLLLAQGHMLAERTLQMLTIFARPQKKNQEISRPLLENTATDILVPTSGTCP
jgi:hypothetical protein